MRSIVYREIKNLSAYESHLHTLDLFQERDNDKERGQEISQLEMKISMVKGWISVLNQDERFVVQCHVIDGLDWKRVEVEHAKLWGSLGKSIRSLQGYLRSAIGRMEALAKWEARMMEGLGMTQMEGTDDLKV